MRNNNYMEKYGFLGIGAFGGNITRQFEQAGYPCIVANSSIEDLSQTKNAKNKLHFEGGLGCAKNRNKSKELLKNNLELLINEVKSKMPEITNLFVCASSAGGTGSGMLAATASILRNALDINVCVVTVLPSKQEQFKAFSNTVELFKEFDEKLNDSGAVFILDNDRHKDKLKINGIFFTHLHALLKNENGSELGCIDRAEIDELLKSHGMAIITKLKSDNANTDNLVEYMKGNNIYAPLESDRVIKYFCLMNSNNDISTEQIYAELGVPIDDFIGTNSHSTVAMAAGLSFPKTRLNDIRKTAQTNSELIQKSIQSASGGIFGDDDLGFLDVFATKQPPKESKKKSSLDLLNEFL